MTEPTTSGVSGDADRDLVARCIAGSADAWQRFQAQHAPLIAAMVSRAARPLSVHVTGDLVDEVAAEVAVQLLKDDRRLLRSYRGEARLSTWVCTIAWRLARDELQRRMRLGATGEGAGLDQLSSVAAAPAADAAPDRELHERLVQEMARLAPRDRLILSLFHSEGRSYREIAALLDMPEGNVGRALARARDRLRQLLGEA